MQGRKAQTGALTEKDVGEFIRRVLSGLNLSGRKILAIIPDSTRTAPMPLLYSLLKNSLSERARALDFMIALGTHPPMSEEEIDFLLGRKSDERQKHKVFNHRWDKPSELEEIGRFTEDEIEEITNGLLKEKVAVSINRLIFQYDFLIILAPTFPHEVVGFSGGNKYFFPGISGPEVLNFFHWLGALVTNPVINGTKDTVVRRVIDKAASMVKVPRVCFSMVVSAEGVKGIFSGSPEEAYNEAAELSAKVHITYKDRTFKKVLSVAPKMYGDLWTGGKCMYKLEPVVADGGELIIYAPHISEVSYAHGREVERVGYHVRDYFLKQLDKFKNVPRAVLAHSTHVKGIGTYEAGVEKPRIKVTLATAIPEGRCHRINLGYLDADKIILEEWKGREDEGILFVPRAGETLFRLRKPQE